MRIGQEHWGWDFVNLQPFMDITLALTKDILSQQMLKNHLLHLLLVATGKKKKKRKSPKFSKLH